MKRILKNIKTVCQVDGFLYSCHLFVWQCVDIVMTKKYWSVFEILNGGGVCFCVGWLWHNCNTLICSYPVKTGFLVSFFLVLQLAEKIGCLHWLYIYSEDMTDHLWSINKVLMSFSELHLFDLSYIHLKYFLTSFSIRHVWRTLRRIEMLII